MFSIYGNRDCNGDGKWDAAKHGGWDVRPPKVGGVVPTKQWQAVCSGRVDWKNVYNAIDLRAGAVTPVYATEDGTVYLVQTWDGHSTIGNQSYGNLVRIRHAAYNGGILQTLYAHLKEIKVKYGQTIKEGELIGYSGNTGNYTGPHLHFEVRLNGTRYNPLNCLDIVIKVFPIVQYNRFFKNGIVLGDSIAFGFYSYWEENLRKNADDL